MPLPARVLLISPAHLSTISKNAAKSFICHTSKNALPQVLCLPHLRVPGVLHHFLSSWSAFPSLSHLGFNPIVHLPWLPAPAEAASGDSLVSRVTNRHVTSFKFFSADEGFYFPVVSHRRNRLCYTDPGLGKHSA